MCILVLLTISANVVNQSKLMRFIILILFFFLFDWYAFQGVAQVSEPWSLVATWLTFGIYWSIPVLAIAIMIAFGNSNFFETRQELFTKLRAILTGAYLGKLLIILILIVGDLGRLLVEVFQSLTGGGGIWTNRPDLVAQVAVAAGVLLFLLLSYGVFRNRHRYKIIRQKVKINSLPDALRGLRIIQISDIHSGSFTVKEPIKEAIEMINNEAVDLVFFTGDLVNNLAREMQPFLDIFNKIKSKYGVFSITGNHDYGDYVRWESIEAKQANFKELIHTHQSLGWDLILNENRLLEINGEKVAIIGVENYSARGRFSNYGNLPKAAEGTDGAALKLLLSHDPSHWRDQVLEQFEDIAITFSGHTHGMQFGFEIPGWFKWSPIKYVYKEWAGLYQSGKQYLYVNRGFGFLGYPGRVGILPEITVIELE